MVSNRKSELLEKFPMKFDFPVQSISIYLRVIRRVKRKSDLNYYLVGKVAVSGKGHLYMGMSHFLHLCGNQTSQGQIILKH